MGEKLPEGYNYCRRHQELLPIKNFYTNVDCGFVDANGYMSVCKDCIQELYDEVFDETQSMEKAIHKLCTTLNVKFSNDALSATREHINTLQEQGKNIHSVFGIYKMKLVSVKKSMDKSKEVDQTYEDVATIYTHEQINIDEIPIPKEVIDFWGSDYERGEIEYLEYQFAEFKKTHKADTYAEIVLLKQVCYTMLELKQARADGEKTKDLAKELRDLMNSLAIAPKDSNKKDNETEESWGLWIQDIEEKEPAQWLATDPRGDMYRDVGNVDEYFKKYIVRPLKNFITMSKDFNIDDAELDFDDDFYQEEDDIDYKLNEEE